MSSSYGSTWPGRPAFTAVLMSQDVYANPVTPLTVIGSGGGGGTAPSPAPVPAVDGVPTSTSITVSFDTAGISGTAPITYTLEYNTGGGLKVPVALTNIGTVYTGTASGLTPNTVYDFVATATNLVGEISSTPVPISTAPAVPTPIGNLPSVQFTNATISTISVYIDTAGVTGTLPIVYDARYTSTPGIASANFFDRGGAMTLSTGTTIYTFTARESQGPISPNEVFYFGLIAANSVGTVSTIAPFPAYSTLAGPSPAPLPPSAPVITSVSTTTVDLSFTVPAQTTPAPGPEYSIFVAPTPTNVEANAVFNSVYTATTAASTFTAVGGPLTPSTIYYTISKASQLISSVGYQISSSVTAFSTLAVPVPPPPAPTTVSTLIGVGFLTFGTGGFSSIILDTSQNAEVGNWQADGVITYGATPVITGPQYLSSVKGLGNKLILSMGGASSTAPVLSTMFGNPTSYDQGAVDLADSIAYAYFNGPGDKNPLGFARTNFEGFAFDGIDLDIESATPSTTTLKVFADTLRANSGFANKIITAAPQTPYLTQGAGSALNANGTFTSFSAMNPATNLNEVYTGNAGNQESLLSPTSGSLIDYHFIQVYNNGAYSYPTGATNGNWNNVVAAWGIQSLQSGFPGAHPKNIYAFATTDGTPLFDAGADASAFNASLVTANSTIRAFSTVTGVLPYSSITIADWCAGIGFWAANTNVAGGTSSSIPVMSTMYGQPSTLNNMPTHTTMTYGGVFNSDPWGINTDTPIPNARGY